MTNSINQNRGKTVFMIIIALTFISVILFWVVIKLFGLNSFPHLEEHTCMENWSTDPQHLVLRRYRRGITLSWLFPGSFLAPFHPWYRSTADDGCHPFRQCTLFNLASSSSNNLASNRGVESGTHPGKSVRFVPARSWIFVLIRPFG